MSEALIVLAAHGKGQMLMLVGQRTMSNALQTRVTFNSYEAILLYFLASSPTFHSRCHSMNQYELRDFHLIKVFMIQKTKNLGLLSILLMAYSRLQ